MAKTSRRIVGCMTGTSLDGLDVALVDVTGEGWAMRASLVGHQARPLGAVAERLEALAGGAALPPIEVLRAARSLGDAHANAVAALLDSLSVPAEDVDFVVAHGQTVWHAPDDPAGRLSWQLMDPWPIVRRLGLPVCSDLRQADLIAGGQGAPITPASDLVMYRQAADAVVNLGGICNITTWPGDATEPDRVWGGDVGPCNLLLDGLVRRRVPGQRYDTDGRLAASADPASQTVAAVDAAVRSAMGDARTLGRETFGPQWLDNLAGALAGSSPAVVLASAVEVVSRCIADSLATHGSRRVVLAGGGARHAALVDAIRRHAGPGVQIRLTDELGVPCEAREAMAMAILGALCDDGLPITLPQVTGADHPGVAGTWSGLEYRPRKPRPSRKARHG